MFDDSDKFEQQLRNITVDCTLCIIYVQYVWLDGWMLENCVSFEFISMQRVKHK